MQYVIFAIIFIAGFFVTPKALLFYDQIEYLRIVSTHNLWQVIPLGHFPIHPVFLVIFWITSRLIVPNLTAFVFAIASGVLMYLISKIIFKKGSFWLATLIFLFFPGVWLVNTNLMVHTILLTLYLLSIYLFLKKKAVLFFVTVFLMGATHFDALYWVPTLFVFPVIFRKEINFKNKDIIKYAIWAVTGLLVSAIFYIFIYVFIRKDFGGSTEQLLAYSSFGLPRVIRNIWYGFYNSFGSLTAFILSFLLVKNTKGKLQWAAWILFVLAISAGGAYWQGDLMQRRIVFAGVLIALALYKYLKNKSVWIILYLIPIIFANGILYYRGNSDMALAAMQKRINELPKGQILLQSHYYQPFTKYDGIILLIGNDDLGQIDKYLNAGKRVFITKESVTAPYLLVVGNNYHITSVGKVGESESRFLFKKYIVETYNGNLELKLFKNSQVSVQAGEPVVTYDQRFFGRLARPRIDYGDFGSWVWVIVTNHRDPVGWTYKDARGICVYCSGS
jgi:hypothetical protein